jgi:hypothetical protein
MKKNERPDYCKNPNRQVSAGCIAINRGVRDSATIGDLMLLKDDRYPEQPLKTQIQVR